MLKSALFFGVIYCSIRCTLKKRKEEKHSRSKTRGVCEISNKQKQQFKHVFNLIVQSVANVLYEEGQMTTNSASTTQSTRQNRIPVELAGNFIEFVLINEQKDDIFDEITLCIKMNVICK